MTSKILPLAIADFIHEAAANFYEHRGKTSFAAMTLKAFNAHQHCYASARSEKASDRPVPTLERMHEATAELLLAWSMFSEGYRLRLTDKLIESGLIWEWVKWSE